MKTIQDTKRQEVNFKKEIQRENKKQIKKTRNNDKIEKTIDGGKENKK